MRKTVQLNEHETEAFIEAINEIKIIDPAVGSGAFPMGILQRLVYLLDMVDPENKQWKQRQVDIVSQLDDPESREQALEDIENIFSRENRFNDFGRKLYLIQNSIFGVDIQPIACQIAKLRFFISLAIEQEADATAVNFGIKPLPNLETRFVAANTLIGVDKPVQMAMGDTEIDLKEKELSNVRKKHFSARTSRTKAKYRDLDAKIRIEISKLLEKHKGFSPEDADKIANWNPYDQNTKAYWFDGQYTFGISDGFDVVVGNPPYVQLQKDGGRLGQFYQACQFNSFNRKGDIYCLFYERALQLLKEGGHVCFITSNKWMRADLWQEFERLFYCSSTQPLQLLDMGPDVFEATVDTNILLLSKVKPSGSPFKAVTVRGDLNRTNGDMARYLSHHGVSMALPGKGEPWTILSPAELALKKKIEGVGKPLKEWDISINYGIKTGFNPAFIIDNQTRERLVHEDPKSAELIKPVLRGRDIGRYSANWAGLYLLFIPWHFPLHKDSRITGASQKAEEQFKEQYPIVYNHLIQYQDRLAKRNKAETGIRYEWYALQRFANTYYPEFEKEKIIYPNMTKFLPFVYDQEGFFTNQKCFIITGETHLKYLVGYFNCAISAKWIRENCPELQGGTRELSKVYFEHIPIPPVTAENKHLVIRIEQHVDQIIDVKARNTGTDVSSLEAEIDRLVYQLYDLTPEEISMVVHSSQNR